MFFKDIALEYGVSGSIDWHHILKGGTLKMKYFSFDTLFKDTALEYGVSGSGSTEWCMAFRVVQMPYILYSRNVGKH